MDEWCSRVSHRDRIFHPPFSTGLLFLSFPLPPTDTVTGRSTLPAIYLFTAAAPRLSAQAVSIFGNSTLSRIVPPPPPVDHPPRYEPFDHFFLYTLRAPPPHDKLQRTKLFTAPPETRLQNSPQCARSISIAPRVSLGRDKRPRTSRCAILVVQFSRGGFIDA